MSELPFSLQCRVSILRFCAMVFITAEHMLATLWPLLFWLCAFFIVWLLQIPQIFGRWAESGAAIIFMIGLVILIYRAMAAFRLPGEREITRRIEDDSDLPHRPLSGLADRLSNPAEARTQHLWDAWQARLPQSLRGLRWPRPRAIFPGIDPFAVRALAVIGLIVVLIIAGPTWRQRIGHGMLPVIPSFARNNPDSVVVWVTPPVYTGQKQFVLTGAKAGEKPLALPEGSIIRAHVKGWLGRPSLAFDDRAFPMDDLGGGNYGLEKTAQAAKQLSIRQFLRTRAQWPVAYIADQPPTIAQKGPPQIQAKGEIKIPLTVQDDYGIETVTAYIRLDPAIVPPPIGTPVDDVRNVVSPPQTAMEFTPQFDLAWHPWAGMKVILDLEARDHKGQVARIDGLTLTLPERNFRHPLAQKLIQLRKRLIWSPEAAADNVAQDLETIMIRPGLYQGNPMIFLSLRSMASHLYYKKEPAEAAKVVAQLWDTALRIEDGNFTMAQRDLRAAQKDLQNALRDPNATPEQIAEAMEKMRQAMGQYLNETFRELQKQMAQNGADPNMLNAENFMKAINPEALLAMLDKMQAQAMSGDRSAAQQMLSQMQKMMDGLDPSNMQTDMPKDMQEMARQVGELQKLIEAQKDLLKTTQDQGGKKPEDLQAAQEKLRQNLITLMQSAADKIGKVPDGMGKAELQMRQSSQSLADGKAPAAIPFQQQAIKDLSEGQQQLSQNLAERMAQMMVFSFGQGPTDPLGRPMHEDQNGKPGSGEKVKIPNQAERKKIQDILEELRKKSGELARPDYELDYYRRLMRQF